jgi:DNA-nicking Smr family endonuclease
MKPRKDVLTHSPFQDLKILLEAKSITLPVTSKLEARIPEDNPSPDWEEKFFTEAMEGVIPIPRDNRGENILPHRALEQKPKKIQRETEDTAALSQLIRLVQSGDGFNILDTAEYIEGTGYDVPPEIARRLHQGDFSIQAHVDLHGRKVTDAREILEKFLRWAVLTGKRGVLIIHGRGLSSPAEPILKAKIIEWLTHGLWRKWIIAYASARLCDGGAGATYVLLRQRPVSKPGKIRPRSVLRKRRN